MVSVHAWCSGAYKFILTLIMESYPDTTNGSISSPDGFGSLASHLVLQLILQVRSIQPLVTQSPAAAHLLHSWRLSKQRRPDIRI